MNKLGILLVLILALSALFLTSCKDKNNNNIVGPGEITPANTDWEIMLFQFGEQKANEYSISVSYWQAQTDITENDTFHLTIDGSEVMLSAYNYGGWWSIWGTTTLNPGQVYDIKFFRNGNEVASTSLRMPYAADATFPATFNPTQSASFSWTLSNNNQYQFAGGTAYKYVPDGESLYDEELEDISPGARSHTVPANALSDYGDGADYDLMVGQLNYARSGRNVFEAYQDEYQMYNTKHQPVDVQTRILKARQLIRQVL